MIDSHAHLSTIPPEEIDDTLLRAKKAGVEAIINIATDATSLEGGLQLLKREDPKIYLAAATTPHDVAKDGEAFFPICSRYALDHTLVAVGETGLDYYYFHSPKELQISFFEKYLDLAKRADLPVIIHCRDAFDDLFSIIDNTAKGHPILLHCFTGTKEEAFKALDRGFLISLSGIITFPKSRELQETAALLPLESILIETDTPYLAPVPHRGQKNEPAYVACVAEMLAKLKNSDSESIIRATVQNTRRFFNVSKTNSHS